MNSKKYVQILCLAFLLTTWTTASFGNPSQRICRRQRKG